MPLPKIRFSSLPRPVWEHILARVEERQISLQDLRRLQDWVSAGPWAPDGDWYKDFGSFMICGSGEFPKTVLLGDGALRDSNRIAYSQGYVIHSLRQVSAAFTAGTRVALHPIERRRHFRQFVKAVL